jgi:CRP-like cAMP-binding protein
MGFANMASHPTAGDLQIIKSIELFRGLEPETVKQIIAPASAVTLKPHTTLFWQGDLATAFFIMINGWTKHYRINASGDEVVTHVLTRGESFAESIALTVARFPATAETVTDARIVRVPADHVVGCIRENPSIALAMIASASQRLRNLMVHIEHLKAKSGVQRLADFLASLAAVDAGPCSIALPYEKTLIAARLGLTPESLSRIFGKLRSPSGSPCILPRWR